MKRCELCNSIARMYCESDQASLCWDCDARIHSANFLVAKHLRTLLCHSCQSMTPWTGSGPKLGPTVSVCDSCVDGRVSTNDRDAEDEGDDDNDDDDDDDDDEDSDDDGGDEDDGENQVVPLSSSSTSLARPPVSSSSSSEESFNRSSRGNGDSWRSAIAFSWKRTR
ncbi:hypothetical protein RJ640_017576 [Escallonia rubra]|uniref:B box-type domain-containing protein n=1 Tax=Escallonia rubra TaxID=112253 RepID=A0AA88RDA3_9ASTE|nr:hypothetical protein RJ640_017576 [Escallonia rubra]